MSESPKKKGVMCGFIKTAKWLGALIRKWAWYIVLLSFSSLYVWKSRYYISDLSSLTPENLIFLIWIVLLLFPLFSEMEFMGVKIKRAIEQANAEVKESIQELKLQMIDLKVSNSFSTTVQIANNTLPTQTEMDKLEKVLPDNRETVVEKVPSNIPIYLFEVRYELEKQLRELHSYIVPIGYAGASLSKMAKDLYREEVIDGITCDLIIKIARIANNVIHGGQAEKEHVDFVQRSLPTVRDELNAAKDHWIEEKLKNI